MYHGYGPSAAVPGAVVLLRASGRGSEGLVANLGTFLAGGATPYGSKLPELAVIGERCSLMEECVGAGQGANL